MHVLRALAVPFALLVACSDPPTATAPAGDATADAGVTLDGSAQETAAADAKPADGSGDAGANTDGDAAADLDATADANRGADTAETEATADIAGEADAAGDGLAALDSGADLDVAADAVAEVAADSGPEAIVDTVSDAAADPASEVADAAADAVPDAGSDASAEVAADALVDVAVDAALVEVAAEVSVEIPPGCADNTREGFLDKKKYPLVAACAGAWDIAGIHKGNPACGRKAGNTGVNAPGKGCNVEDLCAEGWHVCYGAKDLKERNPEGCGGILDGGGMSPAFFLARTSSTGAFNCSQDSTKFGDPGTSNDLFGCGDLGCGIDFKTYPSCDPLNRASHDLCKGLRNDLNCGDWCSHLGKFPGQKNTWDCGKNAPTNEANLVVKSDPLVQGGVLCCVDFISKP